jgi:hypothetical protein
MSFTRKPRIAGLPHQDVHVGSCLPTSPCSGMLALPGSWLAAAHASGVAPRSETWETSDALVDAAALSSQAAAAQHAGAELEGEGWLLVLALDARVSLPAAPRNTTCSKQGPAMSECCYSDAQQALAGGDGGPSKACTYCACCARLTGYFLQADMDLDGSMLDCSGSGSGPGRIAAAVTVPLKNVRCNVPAAPQYHRPTPHPH